MSETGIDKLHQKLYGWIDRLNKPAGHDYWWDKLQDRSYDENADEKLRALRQRSIPLTVLHYLFDFDPPVYRSMKYPSGTAENALPGEEKRFADIRFEENRKASLARMRRDIEDILMDSLKKAREDIKIKEQPIKLQGEI